MARLPIPGSDEGVWGDVLNDYLAAAHKTDGTLKDNAISATNIQDGVITEAKLDGALQTKVNAGGSGADATTTTKGIVQLAGDLSGTAASPTVPGLASKADTSDSRFTDTRIPTDDSVSAAKLQSNSVASAKVQDGAITGPKLANGAVTSTKLGVVSAPGTGQILSYNGTSLEWVTATSPTTLNDLSDVNTAGVTDGQSLVYQSGTWSPATVTGGGGVTDHGALTGLADDDHPQYHNNARGDARYYTQAQVDSALGAKVNTSAVGATNGVASLDGTGKVPSAQLPAGTAPDATTTTNGVVRLAGDLGGTASSPTVPSLTSKVNTSLTVTGTMSLAGGGALTTNRALTLLNDSTTPGNNRYYGTDGTGTKGYHSLPAGGSATDATTTTNGVVRLAGDLSGTAASPTVPGLAGKVNLSTVTTKGDLIVGTGNGTVSRLAAAANGQAVVTDSTTGTGLKYAAIRAISVGDTAPTGTINVGDVWIDTSGA